MHISYVFILNKYFDGLNLSKIYVIITTRSSMKDYLINKESCCFTGHRPQKVSWGFNKKDHRYKLVEKETTAKIKSLIETGIYVFISGMAVGFDMLCAEIVLKLKKKYKNIELYCALPCKNQARFWSKHEQSRYNRIVKKADYVNYICENYSPVCMLKRNKFMVDNSKVIIAFYNSENGGTKQTINYAKRLGKEIEYICTYE